MKACDTIEEYEKYCRLWSKYLGRYRESAFLESFNKSLQRQYSRLPGTWPEVSVALGGEHPEDRRRFIVAMESA